REPGALARVVLRVKDLDAAVARVPPTAAVGTENGTMLVDAPGGLGMGLTAAPDSDSVDYDIDHVVLRVPDVEGASRSLGKLGFRPEGRWLHVGDKHLRIEGGGSGEPERPLL